MVEKKDIILWLLGAICTPVISYLVMFAVQHWSSSNVDPVWPIILSLVVFLMSMLLWWRLHKHETIIGGMVEYQKHSIQLEEKVHERRLMISRHVPSFVTQRPLDQPAYAKDKKDWSSAGRDEYLKLIDKRSLTIKQLLEKKTICVREIYERNLLVRYVTTGCMFSHTKHPAEKDVIQGRLDTLIARLEMYTEKEYAVRISPFPVYTSYLVCDNEIVFDFARQIGKKFRFGIGGLHVRDRNLADAYANEFDQTWKEITEPRYSERQELIKWLKCLREHILDQNCETEPF